MSSEPNKPVQLSPEWWMAYAPSGHAYYHNTTTSETTWTEPPELANRNQGAQNSQDPQDPSQQSMSKALDQQAMASYFATSDSQPGAGNSNAMQPAAQAGYDQGGHDQGGTSQGGPSQGGYDQGSPSQGGYGQGGSSQGGGYDQGGYGQGGYGSPAQGGQAPNSQANAISPPDAGDITVQGSGHIPPPWMRFDEVQLPQALVAPMLQAGFQAPSPIQQRAWPIAMAGRDLIGIAKTGSGKTLAFLLPAFSKMLQERMSGSPLMLVMAPTRELAVQIDADAKKFASPAGVGTALAYGGAPKGPQLSDLRRRPHLLTGTPGRLNDFIEGRMINLGDIRFLCLDEADRMLDMGFEPQIRKVIANIPTRRQTMMFTATWPKEVRRMAQDFFVDPVEIRIGNADELQANTDIDQKVIVCNNSRDKEQHLVTCLRQNDQNGQAIIFTKTKRMCDQLGRSLDRMGVKCEAIHGDRDQRERDMALNAFKSGQSKILVATDVAARGLDVKEVTMVINFDPAGNAEDYVHRIGRTGRAGRKGTAITLLTNDEGRAAEQIAKVMQKTGKPIPDDLAQLAGNAPKLWLKARWPRPRPLPVQRRGEAMPRIRTLNTKKPPDGWDDVSPQLEEFQQQMRDAVNEPHEGKRRNEATWGITRIHYERSRYVYELFYKKKAISRELYDYLLLEKYADAALIGKWKKPGYEYLCSLQAIDKRNTNFGTTAICRVPLHLRKPGMTGPSVTTGCISCASQEAGRLGGPIWWDSPRPADLVGWAKAGCPTADKSGKKRKEAPDGEEAELEARAAALRRGPGAENRENEAAELEAVADALRSKSGGAPPLKQHDGDAAPGPGDNAGAQAQGEGGAAASDDEHST